MTLPTLPNLSYVFVYNPDISDWVEIEGVSYSKVTKRLNQLSAFEIDLPEILDAQKLYVKEFAKILMISNNKLILKGRIQKVTYETAYSVKIEGFGMEARIQDKEYSNATRSPTDPDRVQYDNVSAKTIALELLSTSANVSEGDVGGTRDDYGLINGTMQFAQEFVPSETFVVENVRILSGINTATSITVSIRNASGNMPTGSDLCSGTITPTDSNWITIPMSGTQTLTTGTHYCVVVKVNGSGAFYWGENDFGNIYPAGRSSFSLDSGSSWFLSYIDSDLLFEVSGTISLNRWIMEPRTTGIFATDYGPVSIRFEYANTLTALATLTDAISYDWWVDQDPTYANDYFNLASTKGDQTDPSADLNRQFSITGTNANCESTDYQKDVTNIANLVKENGYGDGLNQLSTFTYNASTSFSVLVSDITSSDTTITLLDASSFPASGTVRIAEEQVTYSGKSGNNLTGCTRAVNGTIARIHLGGVYVEKYVNYSSPEANSSIGIFGELDLTITDRSIRDLPTLELIASNELLQRMVPIERMTLTPSEPNTVVETVDTGDLVNIVDAESSINGNYRIVGIIYENNYGDLGITLEASNKSLTFIEQMQKEQAKNQSLQKYMQGATNIYCINYGENIDSSHPGYLRFYIPPESIAINHIRLNFKMKNYRADSQSVTSAPLFFTNSATWNSGGAAFYNGGFVTEQVPDGTIFNTVTNVAHDMTETLSSRYYLNSTGSLSHYSPAGFVDNWTTDTVLKSPSGTVDASDITSSWDTVGQEFVSTSGNWYGNKIPVIDWSIADIRNYYAMKYAVTQWSTGEWPGPDIFLILTAHNLVGDFDSIKISFTIFNGFNETRTPIIYLQRETAIGSGIYTTIDTEIETMAPSTYKTFSFEDTGDYRDYNYKLSVPLVNFDVNQDSAPDLSSLNFNVTTYCKSTDALNFGIYENTAEFTPPGTMILSAGPEGSETAVATYTDDQNDVDITNLLSWDGGNWYVVKFDSSDSANNSFGGRMRLEANLYTQIFLEST